MPKFITSVGDLQKKVNQHNFIPDLILMSDSEGVKNTEIEIVTLRQAERDAANDMAWTDLTAHSLADIEDRIERILEAREEPMYEFVHVQEDKIIVGIDCDRIDDEATDKAIMMLVGMDSFEVDTYRVFGDVK